MNKPIMLPFEAMTVVFKLRDVLIPRTKVLKEVGIEPGFLVLDYGCGPGGYILPTLELVGASGRVYALDINPLAIRMVQKLASSKGLANLQTILSDCATGLTDESIDVVLLYDIFHMLDDPDGILKELYRVLKPGGILSFSDHHMKKEKIVAQVTSGGLFALARKGRKTYSFTKS